MWPHRTKHWESDPKCREHRFPGNAKSRGVHLATNEETRSFCFIHIQRHIPVEPAGRPLRLSGLVHWRHLEVGGRDTGRDVSPLLVLNRKTKQFCFMNLKGTCCGQHDSIVLKKSIQNTWKVTGESNWQMTHLLIVEFFFFSVSFSTLKDSDWCTVSWVELTSQSEQRNFQQHSWFFLIVKNSCVNFPHSKAHNYSHMFNIPADFLTDRPPTIRLAGVQTFLRMHRDLGDLALELDGDLCVVWQPPTTYSTSCRKRCQLSAAP